MYLLHTNTPPTHKSIKISFFFNKIWCHDNLFFTLLLTLLLNGDGGDLLNVQEPSFHWYKSQKESYISLQKSRMEMLSCTIKLCICSCKIILSFPAHSYSTFLNSFRTKGLRNITKIKYDCTRWPAVIFQLRLQPFEAPNIFHGRLAVITVQIKKIPGLALGDILTTLMWVLLDRLLCRCCDCHASGRSASAVCRLALRFLHLRWDHFSSS